MELNDVFQEVHNANNDDAAMDDNNDDDDNNQQDDAMGGGDEDDEKFNEVNTTGSIYVETNQIEYHFTTVPATYPQITKLVSKKQNILVFFNPEEKK